MRLPNLRNRRTYYGEPITLAVLGLASAGAGIANTLLGKKAQTQQAQQQAQLQQQQMALLQQQQVIEAQKARGGQPIAKAILAVGGLALVAGLSYVLYRTISGSESEPTEA